MADGFKSRKLQDHEERITVNEKFRLRAEGALTVIGFALGGGFVTTVVLYAIGII